jgi:APA family basic amino acid/polyamine antiporter
MYSNLGGLYAFGSMLSFALAHASIIALRIKMPNEERPFKLGWNLHIRNSEVPVTAILGLIGTTVIWLVVVVMQPYSRWVGFAWMGLGIIIYWYTNKNRKLAEARASEHSPEIIVKR